MTAQDQWRIWTSGDRSRHYGDMLYRRATGELPQMESAKAVAKRLAGIIKPGWSVLDVGCGAGHYLTSLRKVIDCKFFYQGVDATSDYIALARKAFGGEDDVSFEVADIYDLPFAEQSFDVVMCNNLLLHLPSIKLAISELYRVTKRITLIRTLIGDVTYRIQEARSDALSDDGTPESWHYLNIYSAATIRRVLEELSIDRFEIEQDRDFDFSRINAEKSSYHRQGVKTEAVDGMQVGGHIVHPWSFLTLTR
jgi:ubiquinone/menaquinone biosynthesis C-methylase UbiE